jgi:UTP--glucose-1-phosphate uridylyltransferase
MAQMVEQFSRLNHSLIGVESVPLEDVCKYGIVSLYPDEIGEKIQRMAGIVEKPSQQEAPSTLSVVGRYILTPQILRMLEKTQQGAGGEIQLTDAIADLLQHEPIYTYTFEGISYDCGHKEGFLRANLEYGLRDPESGKTLMKLIQEHVGRV